MDPPEKRGVLLSVPHWQPSPFALPKLQRQTSPPHPFDLWGHTPLTFRGQKYNLTALDFCRGLVQQMERGAQTPFPDKSSVLHEETFLTLISEKPWKRSGEIYLQIFLFNIFQIYCEQNVLEGTWVGTMNRSTFTHTNHAMLIKHAASGGTWPCRQGAAFGRCGLQGVKFEQTNNVIIFNSTLFHKPCT